MENGASVHKKYNIWIAILSVAIPLVVVLLFNVQLKDLGYNVEPLQFLPPIYAGINGLTAIILVSAVIAIKNGRRRLHENLMKSAIVCSVLFLAMYVAYHMTSSPTTFGDINHNGILEDIERTKAGSLRLLYIIILLSHVALSVIIIPLVLITYVRALAEQFYRHKKIARITFPIWLYVAITGVVVYLMISPYYVQ
jgi:putative membrane protein